VLLVTANNTGQPWSKYLSFIKPRGNLILVALPEEKLKIAATDLIRYEVSISGSICASQEVMRETLEFASKFKVFPMIEKFKMKDCNHVIQKVHEGKIRYRAVMEADFE
jgi:uncharacterized zinc-type alcohol dehydrogenase-like protein